MVMCVYKTASYQMITAVVSYGSMGLKSVCKSYEAETMSVNDVTTLLHRFLKT